MEYERIKNLMEDMNVYGVSSLNIELPDGTKINLNKNVSTEPKETAANSINTTSTMQTPVVMPEIIASQKEVVNNTSLPNQKSGRIIQSPMVGTFYLKPSPTSNPYVSIGDEIKVGEVVCIVEAMKLMNEIESEFSGKVSKILVEDGVAVEYGTPLFEIV